MPSLRSEAAVIISWRIVPSSGMRRDGALKPGVLGGGVDSTAGELLLEGDERAGLEGFEREDE